jgi:uncharacterized membrane-anchored protein YhcB (DUF1043 family)
MTFTAIIIIAIAIGVIIGGVTLLRKSAVKFNLTPEQLKKIKERNEELDNEKK